MVHSIYSLPKAGRSDADPDLIREVKLDMKKAKRI